jgi:hypothetical protein
MVTGISAPGYSHYEEEDSRASTSMVIKAE